MRLIPLAVLAFFVATSSSQAPEQKQPTVEEIKARLAAFDAESPVQTYSISADGSRIAFSSASSMHDPTKKDKLYRFWDVFIQEVTTGRIMCASRTHTGGESNLNSAETSLSFDGRYIVFTSQASNLVPGDTNRKADIFWYDTVAKKILRASVSSKGVQANDDCHSPWVSGNGRFVVFYSAATNLVPNDTNKKADVFLFDVQTKKSIRVSVGPKGAQANGHSTMPYVSADGNLVAFCSDATNLIPKHSGHRSQVYAYDVKAKKTFCVSVNPQGKPGNGESYPVAMSCNGRFIVFSSRASDLVPNDTNKCADVFVYDVKSKKIKIASLASDGSQGNAASENPSISEDGRYVAFQSFASNFYAGDVKDTLDIFVRDMQTGKTEQLDERLPYYLPSVEFYDPLISGDGSKVIYRMEYTLNQLGKAPDLKMVTYLLDRNTKKKERIGGRPHQEGDK
jgi:Tol biopolymer transport system component